MHTDTTRQFRSLMSRFVTGVTVLAVPDPRAQGGVVGMTANAVSAVSLEPLLLLCCVRNKSSLLPRLAPGATFSVNVLSSGQDAVSRFYGGQPERGEKGQWELAESVPVLQGANACFVCEVSSCMEAGDHTVIFGAVREMRSAEPPAPALVYACGRYSQVELAS